MAIEALPNLHQRLRAATREQHGRLERQRFFRALMDQQLPLSSYVAWLRVMTTVVGVLEHEVEASAEPAVGKLWRPKMQKLPLLQADAARFDDVSVAATKAVETTLALVDALHRWNRENAAGLVGALYVFEGTSLGGKVLREKLATQYRLEGAGLAFVSSYGSLVEPQWQSFCERLDTLDLGDEGNTLAVEAASAVFGMLGQIVEHLYPVQDDTYSVVNMLNLSAGQHEVTSDPREVLASIDAGVRTWEAYPYLEARYGEKGRRFTRSDSAWLVTLAYHSDASAIDQIDWLARILSCRGMPSLLLEEHLSHLQEALVFAVPEREYRYRRLGTLAQHLGAKRVAALPQFDRVAASFRLSRSLANVGPIITGAVADERLGVDNAVQGVESWLTDPDRFPADWSAAVRRTIAQARRETQKP